MNPMTPTYEDVQKAQSQRGDVIRKTSLTYSPIFSKLVGSEVYLKSEFQQKTGSFKIRGAYYKIKSLTEDEKKKGVVTASAGNHAQGVAYASSLENISCTVVMPKNASPAKVSATRGYGAKVILEGNNYDESWIKAMQIAKETDANIVHAFDDPHVIAAQGVIKTNNPKIKVIGVQSKSFPAMKKSLDAGELQSVEGGRTIADGISVKKPGQETFNIIKELIDEIVLVDDDHIVKTMFLLMERAKIVVEPAGAAGLAYLLQAKPSPGKKVVPILCGGNIDMYLLGQIVAKGLTQMGRLVKLFILLPDKPGALKELVDEIASLSVNIVEVVHDRLSSEIAAGSAGVTLSLETEGQKHAEELISHLEKKNINFKILS